MRVHTTLPSRKPECCPAFENESGEPPFPRIRNTMATAPPPIAGARTKLWNLLHRSKREEQKTQSRGTRFKLMVMSTGRRQAGPASLAEAINTHRAVYTAATTLSTPGLHPQGWRSSLHKPAACRPPSAGSSDQHRSPHGPFSGPPLISQEGSRAIFIFYK